MKKVKRPTRAQKILLSKLGLHYQDWLVRGQSKTLITLVSRYTGAEVVKYIPEVIGR